MCSGVAAAAGERRNDAALLRTIRQHCLLEITAPRTAATTTATASVIWADVVLQALVSISSWQNCKVPSEMFVSLVKYYAPE